MWIYEWNGELAQLPINWGDIFYDAQYQFWPYIKQKYPNIFKPAGDLMQAPSIAWSTMSQKGLSMDVFLDALKKVNIPAYNTCIDLITKKDSTQTPNIIPEFPQQYNQNNLTQTIQNQSRLSGKEFLYGRMNSRLSQHDKSEQLEEMLKDTELLDQVRDPDLMGKLMVNHTLTDLLEIDSRFAWLILSLSVITDCQKRPFNAPILFSLEPNPIHEWQPSTIDTLRQNCDRLESEPKFYLLINPFGTGKIVMFQVSYDKDWHVFEIVNFLILGVLGVRKNKLIYFYLISIL